MSKSIYEETLKNLISLTAKFVIPNVEETDYGCLYDRSHFYNTLDEEEGKYLKNVKQALEQAQKQEQLLELYKELITVKNDMLDCCEVVDDDYFDIREIETELQKQIKKLESEIEK